MNEYGLIKTLYDVLINAAQKVEKLSKAEKYS